MCTKYCLLHAMEYFSQFWYSLKVPHLVVLGHIFQLLIWLHPQNSQNDKDFTIPIYIYAFWQFDAFSQQVESLWNLNLFLGMHFSNGSNVHMHLYKHFCIVQSTTIYLFKAKFRNLNLEILCGELIEFLKIMHNISRWCYKGMYLARLTIVVYSWILMLNEAPTYRWPLGAKNI